MTLLKLSVNSSRAKSQKSGSVETTVVVPTDKKDCDSSSIILALLLGREVTINKHLYRIGRRGESLDGSSCLYTGVYVKTTTSPVYTYSQFNVGVFIEFIERNLESCEITG